MVDDNSGKGKTPDEPAQALPSSFLAGPFMAMMEGPMREMIALQTDAAQKMFDAFLPGKPNRIDSEEATSTDPKNDWDDIAARLLAMWQEFAGDNPALAAGPVTDPARFLAMAERWTSQFPQGEESLNRLVTDGIAIWESAIAQALAGASNGDAARPLPRSDRRFADPKWQELPAFTLLHQAYLMAGEQIMAAVERSEAMPQLRKDQLLFFTRLAIEALSPAHFPLTNPLVIEKTLETGGENLIRGMEHFLSDLKAGQLTHTDKEAFVIGENIAATPGKVVFENDLFQIIQYSPTTDTVLETPLLIFPPWINRFYILDLTPKKSFVKWTVDQGISTFMVSWKSADASMADIGWEDYMLAQVEAIEAVRARLKVPAVHTIGYCVAGTTLAATLAYLARKDRADIVASATFFTAQVDFSEAGELKAFIDEQQLATVDALAKDGYLDGRYLSLAFNLLRSPDLFWNYVIHNYLLGEDYQAFDLLYWNGHGTNLPARFHREYLRQLYHDNRLVVPDAITLDDTPIDLRRVKTPAFIQAGREDHIAPVNSVWKMTRHFSGPMEFVLAGSGHIAGVVNPPSSGKYQYWALPGDASAPLPDTLDEFIARAGMTPGSWWGHWLEWLRALDDTEVKVRGKRVPGRKNDKVIEDAPGRYVKI